MDTITFYSTSDDSRVLNKQLSGATTRECNIYGDITLGQPSFLVAYDVALFSKNYLYWPLVNRYYYITNITGSKGERLLITAKVDPLMSFRSQIENLSCVIDRAASNRSKWIDDNVYPMEASTQVQNYAADFTPFSTASTGKRYILTTLGGGGTY